MLNVKAITQSFPNPGCWSGGYSRCDTGTCCIIQFITHDPVLFTGIPCSSHRLCKIQHAVTRVGMFLMLLSLLFISNLHLPFSCPKAFSTTTHARLNCWLNFRCIHVSPVSEKGFISHVFRAYAGSPSIKCGMVLLLIVLGQFGMKLPLSHLL